MTQRASKRWSKRWTVLTSGKRNILFWKHCWSEFCTIFDVYMVLFGFGIWVNISTAKTDSWCLLKAGCSLWWRCWQGAPRFRCRQSRICVTEITRRFCSVRACERHAHSPKCERTPERSRAKLPAELWPLLPPFTLTLMSLGRSWRGLCGSTAALVVWQVESVALIKATHFFWMEWFQNIARLSSFRNEPVAGVCFESAPTNQQYWT